MNGDPREREREREREKANHLIINCPSLAAKRTESLLDYFPKMILFDSFMHTIFFKTWGPLRTHFDLFWSSQTRAQILYDVEKILRDLNSQSRNLEFHPLTTRPENTHLLLRRSVTL